MSQKVAVRHSLIVLHTHSLCAKCPLTVSITFLRHSPIYTCLLLYLEGTSCFTKSLSLILPGRDIPLSRTQSCEVTVSWSPRSLPSPILIKFQTDRGRCLFAPTFDFEKSHKFESFISYVCFKTKQRINSHTGWLLPEGGPPSLKVSTR